MTPREESMARHPAGKGRRISHPDELNVDPTLVDVARVTVKKAVDGTRKRKTRSDAGKPRSLSELPAVVKVNPRVWKRARSILAEGRYSRIEVIDSETVVVR